MSRVSIVAVLGLMMVSQTASAYLYGIDVSRWRPVADWNAVRNSGRTFMFTKATEETTYVDPTFQQHMAGAHKAGLYAGAFPYATP